jgi:hypothetical protein
MKAYNFILCMSFRLAFAHFDKLKCHKYHVINIVSLVLWKERGRKKNGTNKWTWIKVSPNSFICFRNILSSLFLSIISNTIRHKNIIPNMNPNPKHRLNHYDLVAVHKKIIFVFPKHLLVFYFYISCWVV